MCDTSIECYTGLYKYLNDSTQLNSTIREELLRIYWEELNELKIQSEIPIQLLIIIIIIFLIMILFGIFGSSLVIFIILNNRSMRTRGNLFILNLAISDLTLCLITQPFNLLRLLTNNYNWILGQFMCKFSAMFQGTNIFVSTFSITAIAIDRFQCIIYPTTNHRGNINTAIKLNYLTWITAFILASPLVYFSHITQLNHLQCTEKANNPTIQKLKVFYSLAALIIQYMTPLMIVIIVYYRICLSIRDRKLRAIQKICLSQIIHKQIHEQYHKEENILYTKENRIPYTKTQIHPHPQQQQQHHPHLHPHPHNYNDNVYCLNNNQQINKSPQRQDMILSPIPTISITSQKEAIDRRHRKAIILSTVIAIIFCLSWLPMNTMNVISDIRELIIISSIDIAIKNLKINEYDHSNNNNHNHSNSNNTKDNDITIISDSMLQHSTTNIKAINQIMSIEANNINAITVIITQALCLLLILSSACLNPILYGWLNKTFRMEFYQVLRIHSSLLHNMKSSNKNNSLDISINKNHLNHDNDLIEKTIEENLDHHHHHHHHHQHQHQQQHHHHHHQHHQHHHHHHHHHGEQPQKQQQQQQQQHPYQLSNDHMNKVRIEYNRSLTPTQDSCTLFSLFTSKSIELNSTPNSMHSGSINNTPKNSITNTNYSNNNNNNSSGNDFLMKYIQLNNDELFNEDQSSEKIIHEHEFYQKLDLDHHSTNITNDNNINKDTRSCFVLNSNDKDNNDEDDDECDMIPETDSNIDLANLRYLPDITSI
ncbi:unnamed protein product [Schistosoma bovis]|nr:unnamed protein product [Schistosoma bovis]